MEGDLRISFECDGHPMELMIKHGIRCESLASVPLVDAWFVWGATWTGELPKGFEVTTLSHNIPEYMPGMFTEGINGTSKPLRIELQKGEKE